MAFPIITDATFVNPTSVTLDAGEMRRADAAAFAGDGSALGVGGGIVRHGDTSLTVTVDGSDQVTIQPGAVVIPGNAVSGTGVYRTALATASSGNALTARNATNGRIDLIVYRQLDTDVVGTHGAYTARIDVITGTPSATPSAPALPSMAVELARITVPATGGGAASVDSSFRTYAAAIGARIVVPSFARLPASAAKYQKALTLDTGLEYEWNGTAWTSGPLWTPYTPTLGGITSIGAGTLDAAWTILRGTVKVRCAITFGAGINLSGAGFSFTLPTAALPRVSSWRIPGNVDMLDASAGQAWRGSVVANSGNAFLATPATTAGAADRPVTNLVPFTWATGDSFYADVEYEAA